MTVGDDKGKEKWVGDENNIKIYFSLDTIMAIFRETSLAPSPSVVLEEKKTNLNRRKCTKY